MARAPSKSLEGPRRPGFATVPASGPRAVNNTFTSNSGGSHSAIAASYVRVLAMPDNLAPLIVQKGPNSSLACVNWTPDAPWGLYAVGYLRAARLLWREGDQERSDLDVLLYPIGLLYRHAIELTLKQIGFEANRLLGEDQRFLATHNLSKLWARCRGAYARAFKDASHLDSFDRTIAALQRLDPNGMTFRYPVDRDFMSTFPPEIRWVDLDQMTQALDELADALDVILNMMGEYADVRADLEGAFAGPSALWD